MLRHGTQRLRVPLALAVMPWLPAGLTKVPIDGQPASIVQELDDMARMYVRNDNVIILAVTPANADLATSDALRMARDVDPSGDRTIGEAADAAVTQRKEGLLELPHHASERVCALRIELAGTACAHMRAR